MKEGRVEWSNSHAAYRICLIPISTKCFQCLTWPVRIFWLGLVFILLSKFGCFYLTMSYPAAGSCKTLVLLVIKGVTENNCSFSEKFTVTKVQQSAHIWLAQAYHQLTRTSICPVAEHSVTADSFAMHTWM